MPTAPYERCQSFVAIAESWKRNEPEKEVLAYCMSGRRSAMAVEQLRAAGFTVSDLAGGITAWIAAGEPVDR